MRFSGRWPRIPTQEWQNSICRSCEEVLRRKRSSDLAARSKVFRHGRHTLNPPANNGLKFFEHLIVQKGIAGQHLAAINIEWPAGEVRHLTAGLLHQQNAGSGVP